ncbi:MAG TPA: gluconate 2-dehydrogenase subunit 3 family protein [Burkholderiaceae bacterium]
MNTSDPTGRRNFLRSTVTIVPAAAAMTGSALLASAQTPPEANPTASANNRAAAPYKPVYFHPEEWAFVQAAVARLIPADDQGPGAIEAGVPEFIDRQMEGPFGHAALWYTQGPFVDSPPEFGYQGRMLPRDVYRAGIAATNAYCKTSHGGKLFAELAAPEQDQVLTALEAGTPQFSEVDAKTFFGFLLQNTKEGYLSDPMHGGNKNAAAWAMIGFPGARADYLDWVGRPGVKYPFGPVTINGPQRG